MEGTVRYPDSSSVVVGVDGSDSARTAAMWAAAEAVRRDRPLHIVYGADTDARIIYLSAESVEQVRHAGRVLLDETAEAVRAEFPSAHVTTEFSRSDPVTALHRAAALHGTVVVGNRGRGGFGSLMLGSVGLKTAAGAQTPMIVVRGAGQAGEVGAVVVGMAAGTAAQRTYQAVRASSEARALSRLATAMMHGQDLPTLLEQVREDLGLDAVSLLERDTGHAAEPRCSVVASTGVDPPERPYDADVESPVGDDISLAARGRPLSSGDQRVLAACAAQLGMAYSHGRLAAHDAETDLRARLTAEARPGLVEIHITDGAGQGAEEATSGAPPVRSADSLALRMSRDLTETMGGTLERSTVGSGFAVTLTLPAAAPKRDR